MCIESLMSLARVLYMLSTKSDITFPLLLNCRSCIEWTNNSFDEVTSLVFKPNRLSCRRLNHNILFSLLKVELLYN